MNCPKVTIARVQGHVAAGGNGIAASCDLAIAVDRYCSMLALAGPKAMRHTKELLRRIPGLPPDEGFEWASTLSAGVFASAEGQEGMATFLEKRPHSQPASIELRIRRNADCKLRYGLRPRVTFAPYHFNYE